MRAKYEAGQQAQTRERVLQRELARMERIWDEDRRALLEAQRVEDEVEIVYEEIYRDAEVVLLSLSALLLPLSGFGCTAGSL